ncbi:MAG: hypothetical protein K2N64_06560 [Anaeroplasmataceae bacterium]|nr:hypothetical protein [Anaeroplasmataceae bacterium]
MGKNNIKRQNQTVPQKKTMAYLVMRIIIVMSFIFVIACTIVYFIEFDSKNKSYFSLHFAIPVILLLVGIIALLLSCLSKKNYSGESKGDNMMIGVGALLILCSIISLIMSYF